MKIELEAIIEQAKKTQYTYLNGEVYYKGDVQNNILNSEQIKKLEADFAESEQKLQCMKQQFLNKFDHR